MSGSHDDWRDQRTYGRDFRDPRPRLADLRLADLKRSVSDKKIMGVCGGLAEWLGVSSLGVRLLTVVGMFIIPPITMSVYILLAVLVDKDMPRAKRPDASFGFGGLGPGSPSAGEPVSGRPGESLASLQRRFKYIEERLRKTEAEVTSTSFRINSELKKS